MKIIKAKPFKKIAQEAKLETPSGPDPIAKTPGGVNTFIRGLTGIVPRKMTTENPKIEMVVKEIQRRNLNPQELAQLMARLTELVSLAKMQPDKKIPSPQ